MAFNITDERVGFQPIADTSTTQQHRLGVICQGYDSTYGTGDFIYLKGVASTVVGSTVVWDSSYQTTLTVAASRGPVAVAMSANVASQYGWYQIRGLAVVKAATIASGAALQTSATGGQVDDTTTAGQYIDGMVSKSADGTPSAGLAVAGIHFPCCNGR